MQLDISRGTIAQREVAEGFSWGVFEECWRIAQQSHSELPRGRSHRSKTWGREEILISH